MMRPNLVSNVVVAILAVTTLAGAVRAAPISLAGLTGTYAPGGATTFAVVLPPITDLAAYNIDLVLTSSEGTAGTDFYFDVAATEAAPAMYVFSSAAQFSDAANVDSPSTHRLTLSDFDLAGTDVDANVNDRVAVVTIATSSGFSADLRLAFDTSGLILDGPDVTPTPVSGFQAILAETEASGGVTLTRVPEPEALLLAAAGLIVLTRVCRRSRATTRLILR